MIVNGTFVLLKPDAIEKNLVGEILTRFCKVGLSIGCIRSYHNPAKTLLERHYAEHKGKDFFDRNIEHVHNGTVIAVLLFGKDAVKKAREIAGATDPAKAEPGTIRGDLAKGSALPANLVHTADSPEAAQREYSLWFIPELH